MTPKRIAIWSDGSRKTRRSPTGWGSSAPGLGDPPPRVGKEMCVGEFETRGAKWAVIRYSRDNIADMLELQKDGERVGRRVTCSLPRDHRERFEEGV